MKLSCSREDLVQGLNTVKRAVATRSVLPILSNILLVAEKSGLKLAATNLEIGINCQVPAQVEDEGSTTVPAKSFADLIGVLPPGQIDLELDKNTESLKLKHQKTKASFKGITAEEFPVIPIAEDVIPIDAGLFQEAIEQVSMAAASDESRPILTGVLMEFEQGGLTLAAADGFRLSVRSVQLDGLTEAGNIIVPATSLREAARLRITGIDLGDNQVVFKGEDGGLASQLIEGNFPDYEQIIPKEFKTNVTIDTQSFLLACKKAQVFAREADNLIALEIGEAVTISARSVELGNSQDIVSATVTGEPLTISANAKYLMEALSVTPSRNVTLKMNGPTEPIMLEPDKPELKLKVVIMPMYTR